jgi:hypothetical protein
MRVFVLVALLGVVSVLMAPTEASAVCECYHNGTY